MPMFYSYIFLALSALDAASICTPLEHHGLRGTPFHDSNLSPRNAYGQSTASLRLYAEVDATPPVERLRAKLFDAVPEPEQDGA